MTSMPTRLAARLMLRIVDIWAWASSVTWRTMRPPSTLRLDPWQWKQALSLRMGRKTACL